VILSELLRKLTKEERLYYDKRTFKQTVPTDWINKASASITLNEESLLLIKAQLYVAYKGYSCLRIRQGTTPILTSGAKTTYTTPGEWKVFCLIRQLPAGSYTFYLDMAVPYIYSDYYPSIGRFEIGKLLFQDQMPYQNPSKSVSISAGSTVDLFSITLKPSKRKTCLGPLKESVAHFTLSVMEASTACVLPRNPDEGDVSDRIILRVYKDTEEIGWTDYQSDYQDIAPTYGRGAKAQVAVPLPVESSTTITIKAKNTFGTSKAVSAYLSQIGSPWILSDKQYEPINLDLPAGSTIYLKMEPLLTDPTKWMALGCLRAIDLGWNYYQELEGTGIQTFSFTFQEIPFEGLLLKAKGWGGCISMIAIDIRG